MENKLYRYYAKARPISIGTVPVENVVNFQNYDTRTYDENAKREVWGYIEYSEPLSEGEICDFELIEE